jgi:hypothetical protein
MISSFAVHHVRSHMCQAFHALSSVIASTEAVKTHKDGGVPGGSLVPILAENACDGRGL